MNQMVPMHPIQPIAQPMVNPYTHQAAMIQARVAQMQRAEVMATQRAISEQSEANGPNNPENGDNTNGVDAQAAPSTLPPPPSVYKEGVSLYVGKLCKEIDDEFFQKLLNGCGAVKKW